MRVEEPIEYVHIEAVGVEDQVGASAAQAQAVGRLQLDWRRINIAVDHAQPGFEMFIESLGPSTQTAIRPPAEDDAFVGGDCVFVHGLSGENTTHSSTRPGQASGLARDVGRSPRKTWPIWATRLLNIAE